ncbi:hypothetical protein Tco_0487306, partial [Tanacetum coccineum]
KVLAADLTILSSQMELINKAPVLQAITLEMALSSTLKASENSLICPLGSLVVGSSRLTSTVLGEMASPLAVGTLRSTLSIMMVVAFRAQRFRSSIWFLFPRPYSISMCHIMPFERLLLVLIVPGGVLKLPFFSA